MPFKSRDQQKWYHATGQTFYDDKPHFYRTVQPDYSKKAKEWRVSVVNEGLSTDHFVIADSKNMAISKVFEDMGIAQGDQTPAEDKAEKMSDDRETTSTEDTELDNARKEMKSDKWILDKTEKMMDDDASLGAAGHQVGGEVVISEVIPIVSVAIEGELTKKLSKGFMDTLDGKPLEDLIDIIVDKIKGESHVQEFDDPTPYASLGKMVFDELLPVLKQKLAMRKMSGETHSFYNAWDPEDMKRYHKDRDPEKGSEADDDDEDYMDAEVGGPYPMSSKHFEKMYDLNQKDKKKKAKEEDSAYRTEDEMLTILPPEDEEEGDEVVDPESILEDFIELSPSANGEDAMAYMTSHGVDFDTAKDVITKFGKFNESVVWDRKQSPILVAELMKKGVESVDPHIVVRQLLREGVEFQTVGKALAILHAGREASLMTVDKKDLLKRARAIQAQRENNRLLDSDVSQIAAAFGIRPKDVWNVIGYSGGEAKVDADSLHKKTVKAKDDLLHAIGGRSVKVAEGEQEDSDVINGLLKYNQGDMDKEEMMKLVRKSNATSRESLRRKVRIATGKESLREKIARAKEDLPRFVKATEDFDICPECDTHVQTGRLQHHFEQDHGQKNIHPLRSLMKWKSQ